MLPQTEEVEERTGIASFNQRCLKGLCLDIIDSFFINQPHLDPLNQV